MAQASQLVQVTREIDGKLYSLSPLLGRPVLRLWYKLSGILVAAASKAFGEAESFEDVNGDTINAAVEVLLTKLSPDELEAVRKELFETLVLIEGGGAQQFPLGNDSVFDLKLQGRPLTVLKLFAFAVEVNFSDFFAAAVSGQGAPLMAKVKLLFRKPAPSPTSEESST